MSLTFTVPKEYPLVLLAAVGTGWVTQFQTIVVSRKRKAAKIDYPQMYAEKAEAETSLVRPSTRLPLGIADFFKIAKQFNCAQRAHQNTLETLPQTLFYLLFSGLHYPRWTAALGGLWVVGRVLYTTGYATGDPKKVAIPPPAVP
ncbi:hypothetical protein Clacol_001364 [Clathrus columnatus]|uniref:Uncharacterized protein n=1 Tax=Clathrus columnatus TaxID=1419009 RepID=A0AAV5A333_9AGAM|nr:hypothetical protein Clacol_001364 [Clathrus columnatus]